MVSDDIEIEPFVVAVDDDVLRDLRDRLIRTRWPDELPGTGWDYGTDLTYLKDLVVSWGGAFDWRSQERILNRFDHFRANMAGLLVHFIHERGVGPAPMPLVLTHGWPSSFVEYLDLIPLLTDP